MTTEYQPQQNDPRGISLARLISSEFGTSEGVVRQQLNHQTTEIDIDGEVWDGDRNFIPREKLVGKTITVVAPERHWRLVYPESE
jgi:hypothetical protein